MTVVSAYAKLAVLPGLMQAAHLMLSTLGHREPPLPRTTDWKKGAKNFTRMWMCPACASICIIDPLPDDGVPSIAGTALTERCSKSSV